jgi:3-phenylpropionate/trans-cinnamate dioxygenase ferredoxin reductase subunit
MSDATFVIVGASLAGAKAAEELRARGFDGRLVLVGAETERPYERPPLTKDYLRGESERAKAYVHTPSFYDDQRIELMAGTTVRLVDRAASRLELDGGHLLPYDRLLLTTGAEPRRIRVPGAELPGVHYLRTLADCDALRARLGAGGRVAVVGGGWIGSEFAASARQSGLDVTLIDPLPLPGERLFGPGIASFFRDLHAAHGVELILGQGVEAFAGDGRAESVVLADGRSVDCDFAVVGIGVAPRDRLAREAGLAVENGIAVDEHLATSAPEIYAAGDVAAAWHPFYGARIRIEHWANALNQGPAAARSMLGEQIVYDRLPYFFSDQYEMGMEYSGYVTQWDEVVVRGDLDSGEFVAFWLREGRVLAGMNVNVWDVNEHVQALIRAGEPVDPDALRDRDTPLTSLVSESAG